jgi:hypothetical protein
LNFKPPILWQPTLYALRPALRDGLRTAQFYVRDMSKADSGERNVAFLSGLVARIARLADRFMTWGANVAHCTVLAKLAQTAVAVCPWHDE